jgi:hypothetical protein
MVKPEDYKSNGRVDLFFDEDLVRAKNEKQSNRQV